MGSEDKEYAAFMEKVKRSGYLDNLSPQVNDAVIKTAFEQYGMPRPARGRPAEPDMFDDRLPKPGRKIQVSWMDPKDPQFEGAQELKNLKQLEEEEKLSKQQAEALKGHYQKYETMDSILCNGTTKRLSRHYGVNLNDD